MNILISACLLGVSCRYDGRSVPLPDTVISELKCRYRLIPVCPEIMGGLPTPRSPAEILRGQEKVIRKDGVDVTEPYRRGAEETLRLAHLFDCKLAVLKERSPSCGKGRIHDGSFSGADDRRGRDYHSTSPTKRNRSDRRVGNPAASLPWRLIIASYIKIYTNKSGCQSYFLLKLTFGFFAFSVDKFMVS